MAKSGPKAHLLEPKAFNLYRSGKYTLTEIAEIIGVSLQTVSAWKQKYDWDARLEKLSSSSRQAADQMELEVAEFIQNNKGSLVEKSDHLLKAMMVKNKLSGHIDKLEASLIVMEDFIAFVKVHYPHISMDVHEILPHFLNAQGEKYGV